MIYLSQLCMYTTAALVMIPHMVQTKHEYPERRANPTNRSGENYLCRKDDALSTMPEPPADDNPVIPTRRGVVLATASSFTIVSTLVTGGECLEPIGKTLIPMRFPLDHSLEF